MMKSDSFPKTAINQCYSIVSCGDGLFAVKKIKSSAEKWRISGLF